MYVFLGNHDNESVTQFERRLKAMDEYDACVTDDNVTDWILQLIDDVNDSVAMELPSSSASTKQRVSTNQGIMQRQRVDKVSYTDALRVTTLSVSLYTLYSLDLYVRLKDVHLSCCEYHSVTCTTYTGCRLRGIRPRGVGGWSCRLLYPGRRGSAAYLMSYSCILLLWHE